MTANQPVSAQEREEFEAFVRNHPRQVHPKSSAAEWMYEGWQARAQRSPQSADAKEVERLTAALVEADSENQREQAEKFRALQPKIDYVRGQLSDIVEDCDTALNRDKTAHEAEVLGIREVAKQALASSLFDAIDAAITKSKGPPNE